ncbi:extensin [Streptomyces gilvus]|uniref:extensin n=1 Tax=Streptomyces gilvus TaxID=2920937 RepID=UPI0023F14358|nr:extensin [Streptomyces sp. CME 23]
MAPLTPPPAVQRLGFGTKTKSPAKPPAKSATGALAASAAAVVASAAPVLTHRTSQAAPRSAPSHGSPPPPYSASAAAPPPYEPPPPYSPPATPPPAYTEIPAGAFDPRELTDFQLDELVHRIIGRVTRLIRTELRLDRERIGKLRDPRR